jgi:thermitase
MVVVLSCAVLPTAAAADTRPDARFAPGELLVRFDREADANDRTAALDEVRAKTLERMFVPGLRLVRIGEGTVPGAAAKLERQTGVRYAEPNYIDELFAAPNDPDFALQWALNNTGQDVNGASPGGAGTPDADIDAVQAWNRGVGSDNVIVAVADTGVAIGHPDLSPNAYRNPGETGGGKEADGVDNDGNGFVDDFRGWDFHNDPAEDNDPAPSGAAGSNHGTEVAGIAGAQGNNSIGIAGASWNVDLMPLRVGDTGAFISNQIQAFGYAAMQGAKVVNLSAGGTVFSQPRLDAINAVPNTLFVFAAGNDAENNNVTPQYPCNHNRPNVLCVAASDQDDRLASFSNFGSLFVDLAAPGVRIRTTNTPGPSYALPSGTSMAAPIVAGAAAVYRARNPAAAAAQTRNALRASVDRKASLDNRVETDGRLNLARALGIANPDAIPNPAPETTITRAPKRKVKTRKKKKRRVSRHTSERSGAGGTTSG